MCKHQRIVSNILFLFGAFLTIQGCDKKEEPKATAQAPAPTAEAKAPQLAPAAQAPAEAPAAAPPATPHAPAAPPAPAKAALATADGESPGVRVEVQELKRVSGGTVMLRFTMINDGDKTLDIGYAYGSGSTSDYGTIAGVHLIDPVGKKKYLVVRDSENKCDCSKGVKDITAKSRVNLWARFPAPPDNVEKIAVVIPRFAPMDDVALAK